MTQWCVGHTRVVSAHQLEKQSGTVLASNDAVACVVRGWCHHVAVWRVTLTNDTTAAVCDQHVTGVPLQLMNQARRCGWEPRA